MRDLIEVLLLRGGHNTNVVLLGTALLGVAAGVVGVFATLRRRALVADALSHAALPGVAGAFLAAPLLGYAGREPWLLLTGALVSGLAAAAAIEALVRRTRLAPDAATAAVLSASFGLGTVLLGLAQRTESGGQAGLASLVFGRTAGMLARDVGLMASLAGSALVAALVLGRGFVTVAFNERFARTAGVPVRALDTALGALVALVTLASLQAVGMLLVVALLIAPAAAARLWVTRVRGLVPLAAVFGGLCAYCGAALSAVLADAPTGAVIVLVATGVFALSLVFAPGRGVLAVARRRRALAALAARRGADPAAAGGPPC